MGVIENTSTFRHGLFTAGLSGKVLTADAEAVLGLNGDWDQLSIGGNAKGGYSVDLVNTKLEGEVFVSGKNLWDNLADGYNVFVDPAIDSLFGRDVPDLGYAP